MDEKRKKTLPVQKISQFCKKWKIVEFSIFGSYLNEAFSADSDIDVLVKYAHDANWSLFDYMDMVEELKLIFGRNTDLVNKDVIQKSQNAIKRNAILASAEVVYVSAA